MGLAADLKAGVASAKDAFSELQQTLVWTRATGERVGTVDGIVQHSHRLSQSAKGDAHVRAGYVITVLGAMAGATLGDTVTVDGRTRRVVGVRGPREGGGERLVTTLDVASHGPLFDPAFFVESVQVARATGGYKTYADPVSVLSAIQLMDTAAPVQGGDAEVHAVRSRIVFPGGTTIGVGDRVTLPDERGGDLLVVSSIDRVINPEDQAVDHIVAMW